MMDIYNEYVNKIKRLYTIAQCEDRDFDVDNYVFEIGVAVDTQLSVHDEIFYEHNYDCYSTIFNIRVRINVYIPKMIKLWKEVK